MLAKHLIAAGILLSASLLTAGGMAHAKAVSGASGAETCKADTTLHSKPTEMDGMMQRKMLQSAYPVQISLRGNALCVKSNYNQLLPVYNQNGMFYAAFRLTKGTNWLSGLPRGTYIINNRRFTIS